MIIGIFGTGRNGTSLLTRLLDGTPNTYVHPLEINFLSAFDDLAGPFHRISRETRFYSKTRKLKNLNKRISSRLLCQYYEPQINQIINEFWKELENPFSLDLNFKLHESLKKNSYFVEEFVKEYLYQMGKWTCHENTQLYFFKSLEVPYLSNYESRFLGMKFIHIIRDPIHVYDSLIRASRVSENPVKIPSWYLAGDNITTIIEKRWMSHTKFILSNLENKNHYLIKYENLIINPQQELGKLFKWLNLEIPSTSNELTTLGGRSMNNIPDNVGAVNLKTPKFISRDIIKNERLKFLYKEEKDLIINITYELSKKLGYFKDTIKTNKTKLLLSWFLPKKWEFRYTLNYYLQIQEFHKKNYNPTKKKTFSIKFTFLGILYCFKGLFIRRSLLLKSIFKDMNNFNKNIL